MIKLHTRVAACAFVGMCAEEARAAIQRATVAAKNAASAAREAWQTEMAKPLKSGARGHN